MKCRFFLFSVMVLWNSFSFGVVGKIEAQETVSDIHITKETICYFCDSMPYENGGVTFVYPDGTFTESPCVLASAALLDLMVSSTLGVSIVITSTQPETHANVFVNIVSSNMIQPAQTNAVTVNLYAIGR